MMKIRRVIGSKQDFDDYLEKLNFVQGFGIPHVGSPASYPCLAITELSDDGMTAPQWAHLFVYSKQIDDLRAIYDRIDDHGVDQIMQAQKVANGYPGVDWEKQRNDAFPLSSGQETLEAYEKGKGNAKAVAEWNDLWDKIGEIPGLKDISNLTGRERKEVEWGEYEATRAVISKEKDFAICVKHAKIFCDRWPGSPWKELLIMFLKDLKSKSVSLGLIHVPEQVSSDEHHVHDYYPSHHHMQEKENGHAETPTETVVTQEAAEPKSRASRPRREAKFAND